MPPIRWMRSIYRTAALRTPPLPKPSQPPSCLHCPVRQRLTYFRQYPTAPHSLFTPPPSTALSDVFPSQPASLTFCSIKKSPPVSEWRLFIHYFFKQPSKTWSPHSPKPLLFLFYFIPDFIQIFFQKSRHIHSQPLNIFKNRQPYRYQNSKIHFITDFNFYKRAKISYQFPVVKLQIPFPFLLVCSIFHTNVLLVPYVHLYRRRKKTS